MTFIDYGTFLARYSDTADRPIPFGDARDHLLEAYHTPSKDRRISKPTLRQIDQRLLGS